MNPTDASSQWPWVGPIVYLATSGGFGAIVWYLIVKHMPKVDERHSKAVEAVEQRHREERKELTAILTSMNERSNQIAEKFNETVLEWKDVAAETNNRLAQLEMAIRKSA